MRFEEALRRAEAWLDEIEGVEGVAEGKEGEARCVTVFVSTPEAAETIPSFLGEHKIVVEQSGLFFAQSPEKG